MKKTRQTVLITGSGGLIGSESVNFFAKLDFDVIGIDNNMRAYFFGEEGSTKESVEKLSQTYVNYKHLNFDIRDQKTLEEIFKKYQFDLIIHTAAQPSHDWAAKEPETDFSINADGTLFLLENFRKYSPEAVFIFTSTNKVYGDTPNKLPLREQETRYEIDPNHKYKNGIGEDMTIDMSTHSLFGVSKTAADLMVQEYGKYFNLKTGIFRGGCLTGAGHAGVQQHGFLSYLVKSVITGKKYSIFGYKGKQVRDNIHAHDLINAFYEFYKDPKYGEVYNIGGSRFANVSILEAIKKVEYISGRDAKVEYVDKNRIGDHIWYISDVSKFKRDYPNWKYEYDINATIEDICRNSSFAKKVFSFAIARNLDFWKEKNWYYHNQLKQIFKDVVKEDSAVLQIGYGLGDILAALYPKKAVSFDDDKDILAISRRRYPIFKFTDFNFNKNNALKSKVNDKFDYIIFPNSLEHFDDIQTVFENVYPALSKSSKVVIASINPRWEQIFYILEKLKLKRPEPPRNWLRIENIKNLLEVSGYRVMTSGFRIILPAHIPLISNLANEVFKRVKFLDRFCVEQYVVAQKEPYIINNSLTCSVVVITNNQAELMTDCVESLPKLGKKTQIVIVDDNSTDRINQVVRALAKRHNIKFIKNMSALGKDQSLKIGIESADSDIILTYDVRMSIPPQELKRFYDLLSSKRADFVSGIRFIYPLEGQRLRQLNIIGNILYSYIYQLSLNQRIFDPLSPIKGFFKKDFPKCKLSGNILIDLVIKASENRSIIKEIPVHYNPESYLQDKRDIPERLAKLTIGAFYAFWCLKIYTPVKKLLANL